MNNPNTRNHLKELEKEFNKRGFFKLYEEQDVSKKPTYPWCALFIRYEAYCYEVDMTLEKFNKKFHSKLIRHRDGTYTFPKKTTESPYCFVYMDLNEITVYDILPETELGNLFSKLSNHKAVGVPTIHKFTPSEFMELSKLIIEYQEQMYELSRDN